MTTVQNIQIGVAHSAIAKHEITALRWLGARLLGALHAVGDPDLGGADCGVVVFLCIANARSELPLLPH
jgi:hypothetical protein